MDKTPTGQQASGNWKVFKGKLREKWGALTDDELDRLQGRREQLVGHIERRVGEDRSRLERDIDSYARETGYRFD